MGKKYFLFTLLSCFFLIILFFYFFSHSKFLLEKIVPQAHAAQCANSDIVLIMDQSHSMTLVSGSTTKLDAAKKAASAFVDDVANAGGARLSLVGFGGSAQINIDLTGNYTNVKNAINNMGVIDNQTCAQCGANKANQEIQNNGKSGNTKIAIFLTDGITTWTEGPTHAGQSAAEQATLDAVQNGHDSNNTHFFTIGLGKDVNQDFLQKIADKTGANYYFSPTGNQLDQIYKNISNNCPGPNPSPPPSGTPYPTLPPPPPATKFYIQGNVYKDLTNDGQFTAPPDSLYSDSTSTIDIYDGTGKKITTATTADGHYATGTTLPKGNYIVSYTSLPNGYFMTVPQNGPPPSFSITLGNPGCDSGSSNDAYCVNGSVHALDFGITNIKPWYQSFCGDLRIDNGVTDPLPINPSCGSASPAPYVITTNNVCTNTTGIVFSGNNSYDFQNGHASTSNYIAGGNAINPEVFRPVNTGVMRSSYAYMMTTAKQSGISPTELDDGTGNKICSLSNCTLPPTLQHGLYHTNGTLYLNNFDVPSNSDYVLLVNGDLYIQGNITMDITKKSTFTVAVKGDIHVDPAIGTFTTDTTGVLDGFYSADKSFIVDGNSGTCASGSTDKRLNIEGSVIVNAGLQGGTFQNRRDLCIGNFSCPAVAFIERPDLILRAPAFITHKSSTFQELAP